MYNKVIKNTFIAAFAVILAGGFTSCDPQLDDKPSLGDPPSNVTFEIDDARAAENIFTLTNTTPGAFIYSWDLGNDNTVSGETVQITYPKAGDYEITLSVVTEGGSGSGSQSVSVAEDLPLTCNDIPLMEFLSNCDTRTWTLVREEGAYWVGPDPGTTWWASPDEEWLARPCAWNDEWTFTGDELMIYDTKGDVWAEDYFGFDFECVDESILSDEIKPWTAGTHQYSADPEGLPTFTVRGLGAFLGLPKASNGAEITMPRNTATYTVDVMEDQGDRLFMELSINFGPGYWRFRYESAL